MIPPPRPTMNVKRLLKIDIVYVFHCCALADLPLWIKQSLQQRMEDWKQRSKTLVDQIHAVDPYYVPTNEYRFIGQASYADIAAGRTNSPSSRNCSPYRHQREATPPTMTAQVLRPAVKRVQKLTVEYPSSLNEAQVSRTQTQEIDANLSKSKTETCMQSLEDDRGTVDTEKYQQDIPEVVVESVPRRGRSLTRKTSSSKVKDSKAVVEGAQERETNRPDNTCSDANFKQEMQTKPARHNTLAPREERRGRSPSPMWVPGSTSYADILRGGVQATQINIALAQSSTQIVSLSGESQHSRTEVPHAEQEDIVAVDIVANVDKSQQVIEVQQVVPTQEIQVENVRIAETYCQPVEIPAEKAEDQNYAEAESTNWTDEALQDYNVLQHVKPYETNVPRQSQPTEIYDYIIPETMPELVGFIGSHLGTYPVSSYVYSPSGHHQQVQQIDTINLNPYNNDSLAYTPEHYVAQATYLSASNIYQQTPMQQPVNDMRHTTIILMEKPVEMPTVKLSEVSKDAIATERIDKPEQQKSVNVSNVETSTANRTEGKNTSNNMETKGQTFSYAQILSHGLSPRVTSTRTVSEASAANYHSKERSNSPKESLELSSRELSPLQESKLEQDPQSLAVTSEQSKQFKKNDWDTMKKREVKKRQPSNDKTKQTDERKSRKPVDKPKEKQKKEKLSLPKQLETQDELVPDKIVDSPTQKEEKPVQQEKSVVDLVDINPTQEKKHRQKRKKVDKSVGDEIDKALKEIEDMDKLKIRSQKDKLKEQNKEQSKLRDDSEIEKYKDEEGKKQSKSSEKSRKSGKSKEITRIKETTSMEQATVPSQIKAGDQSIPKDNAKENMKDVKVSDSKNEEEEEIQKDKEMLKNQFQIGNDTYIDFDEPEATIKCENKNTKIKEQSREISENKIQDQLDDLSNKKRDKINIVDENNVSDVIKSIIQKIELEDTKEKTKIEGTKKQNVSKKEKNKKSKELKLKTEDSINQEKLEVNIKGMIEDKSLESTKPLIEIKDLDFKADGVTEITNDVDENAKNKINSRKRDKTSKNKVKSEVAIDTATISTSKVLNEIKTNLNDMTEKYDVPASEQMTDGTKKQSTEKINLAEQYVSESNNSCLVQAKTDAKNNYGVKIDEREDILGQVNKHELETIPKSKKKGKSKDKAVIQSSASVHDVKSTEDVSRNETMELTKNDDNTKSGIASTLAEKPTIVPEMDLAISMAPENVEIISTEILPKESEICSETNNVINTKEKYQNVENGKLDHPQGAIIKNEDIKTNINNKDFLIKKQDVKETKGVLPKEKTSKRTKRKGLSPKDTVEQTKQSSFYDKSQEEIIFENDSTMKEETPKLTTNPNEEKFNDNLSPLAKIDNIDIEKSEESLEKDETEIEFDSKVSSDSIDKTQVYEKHIDEISNNDLESEQSSSTGKALIIEKMITTVTTTTSVPGSVKVKPPDVKSVKSVEIIENIPLPKIIDSKVIELITLRPETVEASLITTYARVPNDSLVSSHSEQSNQAAISEKVGLTSANSIENIVITDELALVGSVRDKRKICPDISENRDMSKKSPPIITSEEKKEELTVQLDGNMEELRHQLMVKVPEEKHENNNTKRENTIMTTTSGITAVDTIPQNDNTVESQNINNSVKNDNIVLSNETSQTDLNILIEEKDRYIDGSEVNVDDTIAEDIKEIAEEKIEIEMKCENEYTINEIESKEISEDMQTKKQIVPEYLLELIKPYAIDRHAYNQAESNFYRYFKIVKIVKESQPPAEVQTRPKSVERIVQESVMKPVKSPSQEMHEIDYRRHALIKETPKYPIASFYEFESQWIKMKSIHEKSVFSASDSKTFIETAIEKEKQIVEQKEAVNAVSDLAEDVTAINVEKCKIERNNGDKDKKPKDLQQSVHLVSDDSWMSILDEPMTIEDDFDDTFNPEENSINETANQELIDVESRDRRNEVQIKEKQLPEVISEILETPSCIESIEEIQEPAVTLVSTSINMPFDSINTTSDSISQTIIELNVSVEPSREKISDNQLIDAGADTNIQADETVKKNNIETGQEMLEIKTTKISSVHLESDDAWMALLEEEIMLDDDFDEPETKIVKDDQIEKREKEVEKKETKIKQQEKEIEKKKSIIEKQEDQKKRKKSKSQDTIDDEKSKREERKLKSDKKSKKQNQKSDVIINKEKSVMAKHESNIKEDNIILSETTEIESNIYETSPIVQKQQESKDNVSKYDNRLNPNAKSWAAIVGTRGITETTIISKDDSLNTQTSAITHQNTNDSVTNIIKQPQTLIVHDSCEIPSKEETLTTHSSPLENQTNKNVTEELKTTMMDEIVKPIAEKSTVLSKQLKKGNKSYAQVTASSSRISPQTSQEEPYSIKPIPLNTDLLTTNVKTSDEDFSIEKLQSSLEQELVRQSSDHQTVPANFTFQEESIPWVEKMEKETLPDSTISVNSTNMTNNETYAKLENTWAAIVGKKFVEAPEINDISNLEQNLPKSEQTMEQWPTQVQIYVEEAPKQEPIENLVQVDEQGFMEFVNRKELRSRRSRSRSRSARRENRCAIAETSNLVRNKEIKTPDIKSENSENVKAKQDIENKTKQSVEKYEDEQKTVDESDALAKIEEENTKPSKKVHSSKSKDKNEQKNDSSEKDNENKMQFAENEIHNSESKIQEIKPELNITFKGKKNKSKENKSCKDYVKQQEINEQKELKHIEKLKENKKSVNENETEYNKIQLENVEDQSIKGTQLIKDMKSAQENKCKDVETLPIINQDNSTKSKKKKNKKGKLVIEQLIENTSDIDKKIAGDLEEKIKSVELKLDDEVKEEATQIRNIPTYLETLTEETPTEIINKHENTMEVTIETTEQEGTERKTIIDELKKACKEEAHLEKNITEEEIPQFTKAEKRKQKRKAKIAQSKSTDLSDDTNIIENIEIKETVKITDETINTVLLKDKIDDALKINYKPVTPSIQIVETEKPLEKFEAVIENKISPPQITPIKDKQKIKSKSKSKKEKRQQDNKTKSQNFTTILTADSKEIETLSTAGDTEITNLSKDKQKNSIKCSKEDTINIIDETVSIAEKTNIISKESSIDFTKAEKNNIVSIEFAEKLEISNNEKEEGMKNKYEKQIETNDAEKLTNELITDQKENVLEEAFADNITLTEKSELPQTEEPHFNPDDTLKLDDTVNNDAAKIESVLISDKINNSADEIGMDTSAPINHVSRQIESMCDSINAAIKHSPPSDKLSSTVQSFEDENKLKRVASIEQENSDLSIECPKSKVQFYIADEILVLNPDRRKYGPSTSFLQEQLTTNLCNFLSIDDGFWPDKRPYHEAERDHFESLALHTKKNLSRDNKRDFDPRDHDDDNSGSGGSGGRSRDSWGNSRSFLGTPQTERMIADLPGGMCSWSDYSTYLSSESERTTDPSLSFGTTENPTFDSGLSLDHSLPSDVQSSSSEFLSLFPPSHNPQTELRMESLIDAEVTPRKYPTVSSSDSFQSPNHPSIFTKSSTFAHLRPQSKLHLGNEMREGSVQQCSLNGEVERDTAKGEAERRIRRIQVRSPLRPVLGLVLAEFEPSPLPYVYIHAYVYILVVFSYLDCLPLIFRSLCLSFCKTTTFSFSCFNTESNVCDFLVSSITDRAYKYIVALPAIAIIELLVL